MHAFLSASGAPSWSRCHVKPWREKDLPEETSIYAQEGTTAHKVLEEFIKANVSHDPAINVEGANHEMIWAASVTLELISGFEYTDIYTEASLDISFITGEKEASGTADIILVGLDTITVIDYKYGKVKVEVENNEQLLIYAAAALNKYDTEQITKIRMVISQPRAEYQGVWEISKTELKTHIRKLSHIAKNIMKGGADLHATPGEKQCRFCKVRGTCTEYRDMSLSIVADDFVDLDNEESFLKKIIAAKERIPNSDDKHLATCLTAVDMIEQWCLAVRREVQKRLHDGTFSDKRFKLVDGRKGNRKWGDEEKVVSLLEGKLGERLYKKTLHSPAQIQKLITKEEYAQLTPFVDRSDSKPIVVSSSDERPALDMVLPFFALEE